MKPKVVLFILEGPSDEFAIVANINDIVIKKRIRTTVKCMHGDVLTTYIEGTNNYQVEPSKVRGEIQKIAKEHINNSLKSERIKAKDISQIYYITDIDNCFLSIKKHSVNKNKSLKKLFSYEKINLSENIEVPFKVIFFSENLEQIIADDMRNNITAKEKEKYSNDFREKCKKDMKIFYDTFNKDEISKWDTYRESYKGIQECTGRACNMNNLLEEIKEWVNLT